MVYKQIAFLYDELMKDAPYEKWHEFTKKIFKASGKNIQNIIDLGCGTGTITRKLASDGYNMTGVDMSSEMLTYADYHASSEQQSIQWIKQDLRELQGFSNLDAAISYCDVINYITTKEELSKVFRRVAQVLKAGGLFIFDVHSNHHVEHNMINKTFANVSEDVSYIWFCSEGDHKGEMFHDLTFFITDNGQIERFEEYHHQRTFSVDCYNDLLMEAGFEQIKVYADFKVDDRNRNNDAERIFYSALKRSR